MLWYLVQAGGEFQTYVNPDPRKTGVPFNNAQNAVLFCAIATAHLWVRATVSTLVAGTLLVHCNNPVWTLVVCAVLLFPCFGRSAPCYMGGRCS